MLVHWHQPHLFKITMLTETNCMAWSRQDIQGNIAKIFNQANFAVILGADVSRHTIFGRLTSAATFHPGCQGWLVIADISIIMIIMMISPSSTLSPGHSLSPTCQPKSPWKCEHHISAKSGFRFRQPQHQGRHPQKRNCLELQFEYCILWTSKKLPNQINSKVLEVAHITNWLAYLMGEWFN